MKIGILIPGFSADETDWCIPVYLDLARELAKEHDVRVFPLRYPFTTEPYTVYGAEVYPFGGGSYTARVGRWRLLWRVDKALQQHHAERPFDVLHAIWADETGYIANRVGRQIRVPTVVSVAGGELVGLPDIKYGLQLGRMNSWLVHQSMKHATQIVAPSHYAALLTDNYLKVQQLKVKKRLRVVPLGVDTSLFKMPDDGTERLPSIEFLHVGSLNPVKRQDMLLELISKMPGARLDIVGDGALREYLEELAQKLKIDNRVTFHGDVPHHELPRFYQSAKWLLVTSQHEAFCMAAVEAMACGAGVIGTAVGVLPEFAATAPVGNTEYLLTQIIARQRTATLVERSSRHKLVEERYSLRHMVSGLVDVYRTAIKMGRPKKRR